MLARGFLAAGLALVAATAATAANEQEASSAALLDLGFNGEFANAIQPGDSTMGAAATAVMRTYLQDSVHLSLADSTAVAKASMTPEAQDAAGGRRCNAVIACAHAAGRALGVAWVITGTVGKVSNLVWTFRGQLINVATGELALNDDYEVKGDSRQMVPHTAVSFARRVAKKIAGP
jgi:hypothetical protein